MNFAKTYKATALSLLTLAASCTSIKHMGSQASESLDTKPASL